eukprot:2025187-Prymnesium_polylepis.1
MWAMPAEMSDAEVRDSPNMGCIAPYEMCGRDIRSRCTTALPLQHGLIALIWAATHLCPATPNMAGAQGVPAAALPRHVLALYSDALLAAGAHTPKEASPATSPAG